MTAWTNSFTNTHLREPGSARWRMSGGIRQTGIWAIGLFLTLLATSSHAGTLEGSIVLKADDAGKGLTFIAKEEMVRLLRPDFVKELDELRNRVLPQVREAKRLARDAFWKVKRSHIDYRQEAEREYRALEIKRLEVRKDYEKAVDTLISKLTVKTAKTDDKGRFRFENIPPGSYILNTQQVMRGLDLRYDWLVEVQVGDQKGNPISLTQENASPLYYPGRNEK